MCAVCFVSRYNYYYRVDVVFLRNTHTCLCRFFPKVAFNNNDASSFYTSEFFQYDKDTYVYKYPLKVCLQRNKLKKKTNKWVALKNNTWYTLNDKSWNRR